LWDKCIEEADNGRVYAYSTYLDQMADQWDALVLNEYEAVMPLTWRKKWGIYYLYQPFLTAQLGLFGKTINAILLQEFFRSIPSRYRLWEFPLNHGNCFDLPEFGVYQRTNYILSLDKSYDTLQQHYRENIHRNIRKSVGYGCVQKKGVDVREVINLTRQQNDKIKEKDLENFETVYRQMEKEGRGGTYGIFAKDGSLISSAAFLYSHKRAYYLLVGNHPNGRTLGASHALIDFFIRDSANQELSLDFEGSDIRNLAFFYSSFGAKEEKYTAVKLNKLPFYLKGLKK